MSSEFIDNIEATSSPIATKPLIRLLKYHSDPAGSLYQSIQSIVYKRGPDDFVLNMEDSDIDLFLSIYPYEAISSLPEHLRDLAKRSKLSMDIQI